MDGTDLSDVMSAAHCVAYAVRLVDHSLGRFPTGDSGDDEGQAEVMALVHMVLPLAVVRSVGALELASLMASTTHFATPAGCHLSVRRTWTIGLTRSINDKAEEWSPGL